MIFSEKKLRDIANLSSKISTDDIVKAINSIGFEVESVEAFNKNKGIKFGHVLKVESNPNSTKLQVCTIQFNDEIRIIQTAAQNVKQGDYLMAFVPGSIFNGVKMEAKELGKITSHGMLISFEELGFSPQLLRSEWQDDILIIDPIDLSLDPIEYFELEDNLIDVSILSNRSDALSYYIFAKELAAYFKTTPKNIETKSKMPLTSKMKLNSLDKTKLNGFVVKNKDLKVDLREIMLMLKSNIKSENTLNDLAHITMLFSGVCPRMIDLDKINGDLTITKNTTLEIDKKKIEDLSILKDGKNNLSILGVETIENFRPTNESENIFIELSQIDTKLVRDNSRNYKVVNQSSINASKAISNGSIKMAHKLLCNYFFEASDLLNALDSKPKVIKFEKEYLNQYAGFDITKEKRYTETINSLSVLGFSFEKENVIVPDYRHDIDSMQDIVEEVFRFYGLDNFKAQKPILNNNYKNENIKPFQNLEQQVSYMGYTQVWTYTLINKNSNIFNPFKFPNILSLKTFVSEEYNSIRNSMALSMLNVLEYNAKRKMNKINTFDLGMINNQKALMLASNSKSYAQIKADLEKIAKVSFEVKKSDDELLHPFYNALLIDDKGQTVGWIGKFHPNYIDSDFIFAELLTSAIQSYENNYFNEYNIEPLKERSVTFSVDKNESVAKHLSDLKQQPGVCEIEKTGVFEKDGVRKITYSLKIDSQHADEFDKKFNN